MKIDIVLVSLLVLATGSHSGVLLSELPERGPHHRVMLTESGGYVTLANGMHYFDAGEWKESTRRLKFTPTVPPPCAGRMDLPALETTRSWQKRAAA